MDGHNLNNNCPTCNNRSGFLAQNTTTRGFLEQVKYKLDAKQMIDDNVEAINNPPSLTSSHKGKL